MPIHLYGEKLIFLMHLRLMAETHNVQFNRKIVLGTCTIKILSPVGYLPLPLGYIHVQNRVIFKRPLLSR